MSTTSYSLDVAANPSERRYRGRRRRRQASIVIAFEILVLALSASHTTRRCSAFLPVSSSADPRRSLYQAPLPRANDRRVVSLSAVSSTLSSLTVKELRELVKEKTSERGVLSKLKRKQDLVDYLTKANGERQSMGNGVEAINGVPASETTSREKQPTRIRQQAARGGRGPRGMPKLDQDGASPVSQTQSATLSPKDVIVQQLYKRYPPLRDAQDSPGKQPLVILDDEDNEVDLRQLHHPMLKHAGNNTATSDMDLVFVGTASCTPGTTRGVSCTALRLNWNRKGAVLNEQGQMEHVPAFQGGTWLFDVGECTQLQVQRTNAIRPSKITRIFLTHAHGDHTFGLPGLLCLMGQDRDRVNSAPVEIYGPQGLRMWLRVAIRYSVSRIVPPYRVHEVMDVPMAPEWELNGRTRRYVFKGRRNGAWGTKGLAGEDSSNWISQANNLQLSPSELYGEIDGGRDIYPIYDHPLSADDAPVWEVEDEENVKVYAAPMSHGIPCLGYVVEEQPRPGRLRNDFVEPIVRRNIQALKEAGFAIPLKAMAVIKNLQPGSAFTFPDGTVVTQEDAVEPPRRGRKIVLCGDTADSRAILNLAKRADVVIHECTNCHLAGVDKDTNLREVTRDALLHGHSTPQIAGEFCRSAGARRLVLNHFSSRYKGDTSVDSMSIMMRIERQAMKAAELNETQVAAAWDLMVLPVHQRSTSDPLYPS